MTRSAGATATPWRLLPLSAASREELEVLTDATAEHLAADPGNDFDGFCRALQERRPALPERRVVVARDAADAARVLGERDPQHLLTGAAAAEEPEPVFMFSGLGDHFPGMGRGLYDGAGLFREVVDRCAELLEPQLGVDVRGVLFPPVAETEPAAEPAGGGELDLRRMLGRGEGARSDGAADFDQTHFDRTELIHPILFVVEYALARLLMRWGIRPRALVGYSIGELVAACVAGVFTLDHALAVIAERSRRIAELPPGGMLALPVPEVEARRYLGPELGISAVNGPTLSIVGGPSTAVDRLEERLTREGTAHRRLQTRHAFHTPMMEPARSAVREAAAVIDRRRPKIPYVSTVTGGWIDPERATDPEYWADHLTRPVRFQDALSTLYRDPGRVLLEVGPGQALTSLALQNRPAGEDPGPRAVLTSMRSRYERQPDVPFLLTTLGKLWLLGLEPDWTALPGGE